MKININRFVATGFLTNHVMMVLKFRLLLRDYFRPD